MIQGLSIYMGFLRTTIDNTITMISYESLEKKMILDINLTLEKLFELESNQHFL